MRKESKIENIPFKGSCEICDVEIHGDLLCKNCYDIEQRRVERPKYEDLLNDINENGYTKVGKKYGVSDNSIRKWVKYYEKAK